MDTLKEVLKDCSIHYDDIPTQLPIGKHLSNDVVEKHIHKINGLRIKFDYMYFTAHHTYQHDFISIELSFMDNVVYIDASELADVLAQKFSVLNPPHLHIKDGLNGIKKPVSIEFTVRCDKKYTIIMLLVYLMRFPMSCQDNGLL